MLRFQKLCSILGLALLITSLLSCGRHDSNEYFIFVAANLQVPYWQVAGAGFSKAAAQMKVRTDYLGPNSYDPKAERDALDQAVQQKATGILLGVTDPALLKDSIDKAIAAGIPVITMDSDAPASKRLFFIGTNNYQVGMTGGLRLAQELKGKGNVVVFTMPDQHNMQDRLHGYRDALERTPASKSRAWSIFKAIPASLSTRRLRLSARKKIRSMPSSVSKRNRGKKSPAFSTAITSPAKLSWRWTPILKRWIG